MHEPSISLEAEHTQRSSADDRRASQRHPSDRVTSCKPASAVDGSPWPARVRDISTLGIAVVLDRPVEPSTVLVIELENPCRTSRRTYLARVVHVTEDAG